MNSDTERPALDADAIRSAVVRPRGSWRSFDVVAETGSTNADLLARARSGTDINGAVLAAEHQTAGRGRNGRQWTTPPRSQIAVSVGIDTTGVPSTAWGLLPLATGVAVVDAISAVTGVEAKLKWPNDVLVDTGKLAGILAEVASPAPTVVIGTGLNVSVMPDDVPDSVATSLAMLTDAPVDRSALLTEFLTRLATGSKAGVRQAEPTTGCSTTTGSAAARWAPRSGCCFREIGNCWATRWTSTNPEDC